MSNIKMRAVTEEPNPMKGTKPMEDYTTHIMPRKRRSKERAVNGPVILVVAAAVTWTVIGLCSMLLADGINTPPAGPVATATADSWTGFYAGISYGQNESRKPGTTCEPLSIKTVTPCAPAIAMHEAQDAGAFAGYRRDWGRMVGGVEIGTTGGMTTAEAQIGYDAGDAVIYGFAGAGQFDSENGTTFGAGIDVKMGRKWMIGVKHVEGSFGNIETQATFVRFGMRF